jgi:hypothetical protein
MRQILNIAPLISWRFVLGASIWAVCVTVIVNATGAPFWVYYLAPISAGPLMLHELRALDARYRESQGKKKPLAERVDQGRGASAA